MLDWLHTMDKGVGADAVENVFMEVMAKLPGTSELQKTKSLWAPIDYCFVSSSVPNQLTKIIHGDDSEGRPGTSSGMQGCTMQIPDSLGPAIGL